MQRLNMDNAHIKVIELFAGIAGFRKGLEQASPRFKTVWANELDRYACQIYRRNYGHKTNRKETFSENDIRPQGDKPHSKRGTWRCGEDSYECPELYEGDIKTIDPGIIPDHDLLTAGFPCQSFSSAGKRHGFNDTRGTLFFEIERICRAKKPKYILLENVKGLLNHQSGRTFQTILKVLANVGYILQWEILNSKNFSVPQNRERVFIVGHLRGVSRPQVFPITGYAGLRQKQDTPQGSYLKSPLRSQGDKPMIIHNKYGGFKEKELRYFSDYSPTIRTPKGGGHLPDVIHKDMIRKITPVECERLQGFPDNFTKYGIDTNGKQVQISDSQRYKVLGNAVTTTVIQAIGDKLI